MKAIVYKSVLKLPKNTKIISAFNSALKELFFIRNPKFKKGQKETEAALKKFLIVNRVKPIWIFYPQLKTAVETVPENLFFELRTARNKNIITSKEQQAFRNLRVGVAGLSVGSSIVSAMVLSGGPKNIKIADFDSIELTNLNRIQANIFNLQQDKCQVTAEKVWALDPFANLELFNKGLTEYNLEKFLLKPKLDVFIDEMDSIPLKIKARLLCKKNKIPVLMATDNGDGVILDIERYDQNPKLEIFHGRLALEKNSLDEMLKKQDYKTWIKLAIKIIGKKNLSHRIKESLQEIGKTIPAIPQLGSTATLAGSMINYCLRKIANKQGLPSGRHLLSLEKTLK